MNDITQGDAWVFPREMSTTHQGNESPLLDVTGAAQYLATTERHVRRLIAERRVPFVKLGSKVRLAVADLDALMAAGRQEAVRR